jgi:phage shock protein E
MKLPVLFLLPALVLPLAAQTAKPAAKKPAAPAAPVATPEPKAPFKNLTVEEADKLLRERKDVTVIDVRTPEEYEQGHIPGAKNVSFIDVDFENKIKAYEGKPVLVHCASGSRSERAILSMMKKNFPDLSHLQGGIAAWQEAGKEVVKSPTIAK